MALIDETDLDDGGQTLKPVDGAGASLGGVVIEAYVTADYDAGTYTLIDSTTSIDDGSFEPLSLNSGVQYTLVYDKPGYTRETTTITVP